jgi:hypothetical protein
MPSAPTYGAPTTSRRRCARSGYRAQTRWIQQRALIRFIAQRTGEEPSGALVDKLMLGELGAKHARFVKLDGLLRRATRRLMGRFESAPVTCDVPPVP